MDAIDIKFFENEIRKFKNSKSRKGMQTGERYFKGDHDILRRKREVIGASGSLEEVENLPNHRIVDNQYRKMVKQKSNYLLGKPFTVNAKNEQYAEVLKDLFNLKFMRDIKRIGQDSLNCGLSWLLVYYDAPNGALRFKRVKAYEICPGWKDADHTVLDYAIRLYEVDGYNENNQPIVIEKVEIYKTDGIYYFELTSGGLVPDKIKKGNYFYRDGKPYNWEKVPLIPFRYNEEEQPLIRNVKSLQDGINLIKSNFENNMDEDVRSTIFVLLNYGGENLGTFRRNLATYGAVKINSSDGMQGDLKTLQIEVNAENYKVILDLLKKALIENAMGYDAKDDRLSGNANQMNILSMYHDIDLDADGMETEYQAAFEELLWFINCHLANTGGGNFENEDVEIIFNRDILISESDVIDNIQKSIGILSTETLIAQHPWVDDVDAELAKLKKQEQEYEPFPNTGGDVNELLDRKI